MLLGPVINRNSILFHLKDPLKQMIDPDFLLTPKLMNREVLTDAERQSVINKDNFQQRNDTLLNIILQKNDEAERQFIACLHDTDQQHVWNFINCGGG